MKERPILFSGPMVRAILEGRKTQTRRTVKGAPENWSPGVVGVFWPTFVDRFGNEEPGAPLFGAGDPDGECWMRCPYGKPGDRLRISEEVTVRPECDDWFSVLYHADRSVVTRPCDPDLMQRIKNYKTGHLRGVSLPPAYARPERLEITGVRVERLNDITEIDAVAEGVDSMCAFDPELGAIVDFQELWQSINGPESWAANPWVWVVEFSKVEPQPKSTADLLRNLREASGNAWDDVVDVRAELADMRGTDDDGGDK